MSIQLTLANNQINYRPSEAVNGWANWNLTALPKSIEFRLIWFTRGKGNQDLQIVQVERISPGATMGDAPFHFRLPDAPHSFAGTLISLVWAVEAVSLPSQNAARIEFFLSPTGAEIVLLNLPQPSSIKPFTRIR